MAITHREQVQVLCRRYHISAAEAAENAKADRESGMGPWRNVTEYEEYLNEMEFLGEMAEAKGD